MIEILLPLAALGAGYVAATLQWRPRVSERTRSLEAAQEALSGSRQSVADIEAQLSRLKEEVASTEKALEATTVGKSLIQGELEARFRGPMTRILGLTEQLWETELSAVQREDLTTVRRSASQLVSVINDCLDYGTLEQGRLVMDRIPFRLPGALGNTLNFVRMGLQVDEDLLWAETGDDVPDDVVGDAGRVRQVLVYYLRLALSTRVTRPLVLRTSLLEDSGADVKVRIELTAPGMDPTPLAPEPPPTTLAAALNSALVQLMGGDRPLLGENPRFRLVLRFHKPTVKVRLTPPQELVDLEGALVMVVAEHENSRHQLERQIRSWNMKPLAVAGTRAAVDALKALPSDTRCRIVLVDSSVATEDALPLPRLVRQESGQRPCFLLMTWVGWRGEAAQCREAGYAGYLTRPVTPGDLFDAITASVMQPAGSKGDVSVLVTRHVLRETRRRLTVLVAEDNRLYQSLMRYMLEDRGYTVQLVGDGKQAVAAWKAGGVDVILMDVQMPEMDGLEAATEIRRLEKGKGTRVPIIAATANTAPQDKEQCLRAGMDGYVPKPIHPEQLFQTIDTLLGTAAGPSAASPNGATRPAPIQQDLDQFFAALSATSQQINDALAAHRGEQALEFTIRLQEQLETFPAPAALQAATQLALFCQDGKVAEATTAYRNLVAELDRLRPVLARLAREEKVRVVVAEDDDISRTVLEDMLVDWGYEVLAVSDGISALNLLQSDDPPRMAILDWMMPGMDGLQVCREVRRKGQEPYIYMLLLTARSEKEDIVEGLDAGADDYLVKPVDDHELKVRLRAGRRVLDLQEELISAREVLRAQATRDPLTGLLNRAALLELVNAEMARGKREHSPVGLAILDLDHFKSINDTYGHHAGDVVLRESARRLRTAIRPYDGIGRFGGEEFIVVLPGADTKGIGRIAERLRQHLCAEPVAYGDRAIPVSASFGMASTSQLAEADMNVLTRAADAALYRAKKAGRNRCELAVEADFPVAETGVSP